jgi:hypothetical protein
LFGDSISQVDEWGCAVLEGDTGGNADGCENKGVARQESGAQAGKAIRNDMKTKGGEIDGK